MGINSFPCRRGGGVGFWIVAAAGLLFFGPGGAWAPRAVRHEARHVGGYSSVAYACFRILVSYFTLACWGKLEAIARRTNRQPAPINRIRSKENRSAADPQRAAPSAAHPTSQNRESLVLLLL